ncbi:166_t:CDS:2, partial [Gigaspora rosea]
MNQDIPRTLNVKITRPRPTKTTQNTRTLEAKDNTTKVQRPGCTDKAPTTPRMNDDYRFFPNLIKGETVV